MGQGARSLVLVGRDALGSVITRNSPCLAILKQLECFVDYSFTMGSYDSRYSQLRLSLRQWTALALGTVAGTSFVSFFHRGGPTLT